MSDESDVVDRLAQSIADGASIDWDEIDKLPADNRLRRLLDLLRMVDGLAEVHRSLGDVTPATDPTDSDAPSAAFDVQDASGALGQWGHLLLRRKIGEGAFGEVYHAHDTWLDHPVALKLFKPTTTSRNSATRILHEARKLARIRHPNIVTVHGADSHDGRVGFWMDLIEGTTLEEIVLSGRLSAGEAAYIGQEVCRALAAVHIAGIIHRDVKAQNVMRAADGGRIILMDFGAGEFVNDQTANPRKQGTPLYLAPEIFAGKSASVQSDIYAVGVLLYFLVTGAFPVSGSTIPDLISAHRKGDRRRLRDQRPDVPSVFVSIVDRALDVDPARRFGSAGEMEAALAAGFSDRVASVRDDRRLREGERTALQIASQSFLALAAIVLATLVVGLLACRAFETSLGVDNDFAAGFGNYAAVGVQVMLPFVLFWMVGAVVLALLAALKPLLLRGPLAALRDRVMAFVRSCDGESLATMVFLAGVAGWLVVLWRSWELFVALEALRGQGRPASSLLVTSAARTLHVDQVFHSTIIGFFLALAAWRWFPALERQTQDPSRVRVLRWATVGLIVAMIVATAPARRFVWDPFEVASFENERALVIGRSGDELLLYYPNREGVKYRRVPRDAPMLNRTGVNAFIFDRQ